MRKIYLLIELLQGDSGLIIIGIAIRDEIWCLHHLHVTVTTPILSATLNVTPFNGFNGAVIWTKRSDCDIIRITQRKGFLPASKS